MVLNDTGESAQRSTEAKLTARTAFSNMQIQIWSLITDNLSSSKSFTACMGTDKSQSAQISDYTAKTYTNRVTCLRYPYTIKKILI